jgi:hypothetical protein
VLQSSNAASMSNLHSNINSIGKQKTRPPMAPKISPRGFNKEDDDSMLQ